MIGKGEVLEGKQGRAKVKGRGGRERMTEFSRYPNGATMGRGGEKRKRRFIDKT